MASIEFIQSRIDGKIKEIERLEKKMARIEKAAESNWENNPYYYSEYDRRSTERDLVSARKSLEDYQKKLQTEIEKSNSRDIQVIIEFLNNWKEHVIDYYLEMYPKYVEARDAWHQEERVYIDWFNSHFKERRTEEGKERDQAYRETKRVFNQTWSFIIEYVIRDGIDIQKLRKHLNQEADRKYDFIIERTNEIVGQITDASDLKIGLSGELNGIIQGTRGAAKVQTIGAGGYNIQCYHFRTLINPVK